MKLQYDRIRFSHCTVDVSISANSSHKPLIINAGINEHRFQPSRCWLSQSACNVAIAYRSRNIPTTIYLYRHRHAYIVYPFIHTFTHSLTHLNRTTRPRTYVRKMAYSNTLINRQTTQSAIKHFPTSSLSGELRKISVFTAYRLTIHMLTAKDHDTM